MFQHNLNGEVIETTFDLAHKDYTERGLVLRLMVRVYTTLKFIDELQFDERKGLMEFHHDGSMFAIYFTD